MPQGNPSETILTCRTCGTVHTLHADGVVRNCERCGGHYYTPGTTSNVPDSVRFHVEGRVQQKARHRTFVDATGNARMYTPKQTQNYQSLIKDAYMQAVGRKRGALWMGPVQLDIFCQFPVPKSRPKWFRELVDGVDPVYVTTSPDVDNVSKGVQDALSQVAFYDDRQICVLLVVKRYSEIARLTISITYLPEPQKPQKEEA